MKLEQRSMSSLSDSNESTIKDETKDTDKTDCHFHHTKMEFEAVKKHDELDDDNQKRWVNFDNVLNHCKHINCIKSAISLSKLKGLQDELDIP